MRVYLDDLRNTPPGFNQRVNSVLEAIDLFTSIPADQIEALSLDHDLGHCERCAEDINCLGSTLRHCKCHCHLTGYDLVCWMEENNYWPKNRPTVHSANPVGRNKMLAAIERAYQRKEENGPDNA
jgi:hypothetical protein